MQLQLPFFPAGTKLINETLGFCEKNGIVYYLHNGDPIFNHSRGDLNSLRFILANLIVNKLCKVNELSKATGIDRSTIDYYVKVYQEQGITHFFVHKSRLGQYYKMKPEKLSVIQADLDEGLSIKRTALNHGVSVTTINKHIKYGNLIMKKIIHQQ